MEQSIWLQNYEQEVKAKRNTSNEQKVIMNGLADSGKQLEAIIDMLQTANPNITLA